MSLQLTFVALHILGTILGVGGATFAEIFLIKALRDGVIEPLEGDYLKTIYTILRVGLIITVISGFGFLFLYRVTGHEELLYNPKLWAKLTIVTIILINALLLQAHKIPLRFGGAISLASWYSAMLLGIWRTTSAGYLEILGWYILAVIIVKLALDRIHKYFGVHI